MIYGLNGQVAQNPVHQMSTLGMKFGYRVPLGTEEQGQENLCGRTQRTGGIVVKNGMKNG